MAQESHFRAALFGGFQKSDVLEYIEKLQNQILALQGEKQQRNRELPSLRSQIEALTSELEQARLRERGFFDNAEELQRQIHALESDRDDLRKKLRQANAGQERVKDVEGQVGTLILDALLYSEKIIARAKETAQIIAQRAQDSVRGTASEVDGLGEDMTRISQDFSTSISQLVGRIKGVSADLSGVAEKLEPDLSDGNEQYTFNSEGIPVLREEAETAQSTDLPEASDEPDVLASDSEEFKDPSEPIPGGWFADAPLLPENELPQPFELPSEDESPL